MDFDDTFAGAIQKLIKEKINEECRKLTKEAIDDLTHKLYERVNTLVAEASVEILNVVSFERIGNTLRIEVTLPNFEK